MNKKVLPIQENNRHKVVLLLVAVGFSLLALRAVYLHTINQAFLQKQGDARMLRVESIPAHRGILRDRNGIPLAVSTPVVSIWVNPKEVLAEHTSVFDLAKALSLNSVWLREKINNNKNKEFVFIKRHLSPDAADKILKANFAGVYGTPEYRRFYPEGEVTSHLLGFTNLDDKGSEGLELAFDDKLKGVPGAKRVLRDLKGAKVKDVALIRPPQPGQDIYLSFDTRIQYLAYRELADAVLKNNAVAGMAVALSVDTGEVLAMVNMPAYNPNNKTDLQPDHMRNRAVTDTFEPGSTMKPFTVAAGLLVGKYTTESKFNTNPGSLQVRDKKITDHENLGVIDLGTIITKSSNVGAAKIALSLERTQLPAFFTQMGFGQSTQSKFPGESSGRMHPPSQWNPVEIATMSYGYGITVTALQLAHAYATLASGGVDRPVSFVKVDGDVVGKRVLDAKIAQALMPMMESVVTEDGTALRAAVPGYRVAGKTGTAHKASKGGYSDQYMSTFVGLAPASHPKIVLVVVIDSPSNGQYYGGVISAPVFSRIMSETLRLMNVEPDKSTEHLASQNPEPIKTATKIKKVGGDV